MSLPEVQTPEVHKLSKIVPIVVHPVEEPLLEPQLGLAQHAGPDATEPAKPASRRSRLRRKPVLAAAAVVLLCSILAGTLVAMTKTVSITVDGRTEQVSTLSGSVSGALASAGLTVAQHDVLVPAADQSISDGSTIALNRGRLLTVSIDGTTRQIWTTAVTVEDALAQLGQDTSRLSLSADRSRGIPLEGLTLTAATLHTVTVTDGAAAASTYSTPAVTVAELLAEKHVVLGAQDTVTPGLDSRLADGIAVAITRVLVSTTVENEPIAQPADVSNEDPNLDRGTTTVTVPGSPGTAAVTYQVTTVNGAQTAKTEISRTVAVQPVATQVSVGTKTTLTWVGNQVFFHDTEFGVNWDGLAMCESTHNPKAVNANPSAGLPTYGLFQFDLPTWKSVGGSGNPVDATPEEQIMRAKLLYQSRGLQPWACAHAAR